jgi:adenylylsulfate kinase-like enzyme
VSCGRDKASIEICRQRDPKGIYKKAEEGMLSNVTGIQDPFEPPIIAELVENTEKQRLKESAEMTKANLVLFILLSIT